MASSEGLKFHSPQPFRRALAARVEPHLAAVGRRSGWPMARKAAILIAWAAISYVALVAGSPAPWLAILASISLGLAVAGIGFSVMHDGNHGGFSASPRLNRAMGRTLDLLGGSSYLWRYKHNVFHHTYPNVTGLDDDIDLGALCRMSPSQPRRFFHRLQHFYLWPLYGLIVPKWHLLDDFKALWTARIGPNPIPRPKGIEVAVFWGGKVIFFGLAFAIPLLLHPVWSVLGVYGLVALVQGITLSIVFQLAHVNVEADDLALAESGGKVEREWAAHQVETTVDFARGNRLLTWYTGGLNHQIEHHLFPQLSHLDLPAIAPIVEEVSREHGVRYSAHPTMWTALASHYRWLRAMGQAGTTLTAPPPVLRPQEA
jgi:linoleoyl-CoA desaturase